MPTNVLPVGKIRDAGSHWWPMAELESSCKVECLK